jgi:hypothetical protein
VQRVAGRVLVADAGDEAGKRRRPAEPGEAEGDLEMIAAGIVRVAVR